MLEEQGFSTGIGQEGKKADNPLGTRESRDLVALNEDVLELNGRRWDRPPKDTEIRFTARDVRRRDRLVARISTGPALLKDPRMVILREFWNGVPLSPIGVIRDPIAVDDSLRRREPRRTRDECLRIWHVYNAHLLRWLKMEPFPVIEFGGASDLRRAVTLALRHYGLDAPSAAEFFDADLIRSEERGVRWREEVPKDFSNLWDEILSYSVTPPSAAGTERGLS